ncbi:aminopeptidase N-like [Chironomus tepperi]|uniref:aminopeptidase N-like n=1 Tax=Chironomus tepperi TaxID=113505 RepID=UPI00391F0D63
MKGDHIAVIFLLIISTAISSPVPPPTKFESSELPDELLDQVEFKFIDGRVITGDGKIPLKSDDDITYRLPNNTLPVRYDLWVKTDVEKQIFNFQGHVKIQVRAMEPTDYVTLQYRDIVIDRIDLLNENGLTIDENLTFEYLEPLSHEFLKIHLVNPVDTDARFTLDIIYHGELHEPSNNGFYKAYYITANNETIWYATTKFEPHHARHLMPCYDEPAIRAPIGLQVQHDKSYNTYANMPLKNRTVVDGSDYVISEFVDTPPMQTYLLAFLVSAFKYVSNNASDVEQRIFAKPQSIDDGEGDYAASISDGILKKFEQLLDVKYPLPKLDHAAITQFPSGAMENFGFISYQESALLLRKSYTPAQNLTYTKYIARLIAHEVAHQWFGNTVSPQWWTYLWLNEGFATLYEYLIPHILYPELNFREDFRTACLQASLRNDLMTNPASVPMSHYVEEPTAIRGRFNFVSYQKAGTVLMMFLEAFGIDIFHHGLTKYLIDNYYGVGNPTKLFTALQSSLGDENQFNLTTALSSWTTQAGYPILHVERSGNKLKFSQQRYPAGNGEIYAIPLTFATKSNAKFDVKTAGYWIKTKEEEVDVNVFGINGTDWIIFNNQQVGYYRIDYSDDLWHAIADGLRHNVKTIDLINRRILQEELNIGMTVSKSISASTMLEILSTLENERSNLVWNDANVNIQFLNRTLMNTVVYENYMELLREITKPIIDEIGYEATDSDPIEITQLRLRVRTINCYAFDDNCMQHELTKLIKYHENENVNPAPDFCTAFRLAEQDIYDHYLNELITNSSLKNRNLIAQAIHCTLNKDYLGVLITAIEDDKNILTEYERGNITNRMLTSSPISFNVAFDYIKRNVEKIILFKSQIIAAINTQEKFDELKLLLSEALNDKIMTQAQVDEIKDAIDVNLKWQEKHLGDIRDFFRLDEVTTLTANGIFVSFYLIITSFVVINYFTWGL